MADYPAVAASLKDHIDGQLEFSSFVTPSDWPYRGEDLEQAAEALVAGVLVGYTALADTRMCTAVKVWKTIDDWAAIDTDVRLTLTTGSATRALSLKIVLKVDRSKLTWGLELFDWDTAHGKAVGYTGSYKAVGSGVGQFIGFYDEYVFKFDTPPSGSQAPAPQRRRKPPKQRDG